MMPPPALTACLTTLLLGAASATVFTKQFRLKRAAGGNDTELVARGSASDEHLYEHTLESEKQMVFTHRINIPPQNCGCPDRGLVRTLLSRLEMLEAQVRALKQQCPGGTCCAGGGGHPGAGQMDVRALCSQHGRFDLAKCSCQCDVGWQGPTCSEPSCPSDCHGHGTCVDGSCVCQDGFAGESCEETACPDDCNDQGRCVGGRCVCFRGYAGPSCGEPSCPGDCGPHGRCVQGACLCEEGFGGPDCGTKACPENCRNRGRCIDGACACEAGFGGPECGTKACPRNCRNQGQCFGGECICDPGFTGPDCGLRSCPENCRNRGRCVNGKCACDAGFTGPDCGAKSCPENCRNRGRCVDGTCVCNSGYTGPNCAARSCPENCRDRGQCVNGKCICNPGYTGTSCGSRTCPDNCSNRGRCEDGRCICHAGFTGPNCGTRTCPDSCMDRGQCVDGRCTCDTGFTGLNCGTRTCPNNCMDRGQCIDGQCTCDTGFTGPNCGTRTCPDNCMDRGQCVDGRCTCDTGFTGPNCGTRTCPDNCMDRGQCIDGQCTCDTGFTGPNCGTRTCPDNCMDRGQCVDGGCTCDTGFTGPNCGTRTCPDNCMDRGQCIDGQCTCDTGFTGPNCGTRTCPDNCMDRGQCVDGRCTCDTGFTGPNCGTRTCPDNCMDRGQCVDGRCTCDTGFTGPNCDTKMCPDNCKNHGQCVDGQCLCKPGYTGHNCGTRTCPGNCNHRGRCENGKCLCEEGYSGPVCGNKACPGNCSNQGRCLKGVCLCRRGYAGLDCGQEACPNQCSRRGTCQDGHCLCAEGYSGEDCSEEIPAVEGLAVRATEETSVTLGWSRPPAPVDGYEISFLLKKDENGIPSARLSGTATDFHQTGLAPGQEYTVAIRARKGRVLGPETTETFATLIDAPKKLRLTEVTPSTLALRWERPAASVDLYVIVYVRAGGERRRVEVPGAEDSAVLGELDGSAEYDITVVARRAQEESKPTSIKATTAPPGPQDHLNHLGDLTVENVEEASFRLAWKARKGAYDSFLVRYEDTAGQLGPQETSVAGDLRASVVSGLSPDTEYAISLYGVHDGFLSRPLKTAVTTAPLEADGIRPRVENLAISDVTRSSVRLSWEVEDGDFDYFLLQYEDPQGRIQEQRIRGDLTSTTITGLLPSQNYTFTLYGISDDKRSKPVSIEVTTASADPPAALLSQLGSLSVSEVSENSLRLSWTVRAGSFDTFLLQYRDSEGRSKALRIRGDLYTATIPGLRPAWTYKFNLYGVAAKKHSKPISVEASTASAEKPAVPPELGALSASAVTESSLRLSWAVRSGGFDSFLIMYRDSEGRTQKLPVAGGERAATVTGLAPATQYKFHLYGVSRHGHTKPTSTEATTALPKKTEARKASLGELSISDVTEDSLRLSWTVQDGEFDSFLLLYRDVEGKHQEVPVSGERQTATISGLKPSKKYKFTLYGVSDNKRSKPVSAEATTDSPKKTVIQKASLGDLSVSNITEDSLQLLWTVQEGEFDSFLILYRNADGEPQEVPVSGELRTTVISGLKPSKKYKFNLYGASDDKRSKPVSAEAITASLKKTTAQKASLGDLSVSDITEESLRLSWTVQDGKFDSFLILYKNADGEPQEVTVGGDFQTAIISGLRPSKKYKFTLYGVSDSKRSKPVSAEATAASVKKPATQKAILGDLSISNVTEDALRLTWTVQDGEFNSFLIQYRDTDGKPLEVPINGEIQTTIISGLEPSRKYKFSLYGVLDNKRSKPVSAEATTTSKIMTEKATLGDLSISDVTEDALRLSWTVQDGEFDSFLVQYSDEKGKSLEVPIDGELHTAIISDLEPSRKYNFNLYGVLDNKRSTPVSAEATTASKIVTQKATLGNLSISNVTEDALRLSWTVRDGNFEFFLVQYSDEEGTSLEVPVDRDLLTTIISGLKPSKKYKFNLYGVENNERSTPVSAEVTTASMKKTLTQAAKLGDLSVANITEDSLRLSWTVQDGKFDSFLIQYKDVEGKLQEVLVGGELRTTIVAGLKPSKKYKFNLYGVSDNKRSKPVSAEATTAKKTTTQKATLGDLSISNITEDSLHLSWTVQGGEFDSFLILYRNADGELQEVPLDGKLQTFIITGLKPSKKYKFQFYGVSDSKRSKPVSAEAITASPKKMLTQKASLGDLSISDVTENSLRLSWTVQDGAFGSFLIHYRDADGKPQEVPVDGAFDSTIISGLKPSKKYKFNLYGVTDNKRSKPLSAEATTGAENLMALPRKLVNVNSVESHVKLRLTKVFDPSTARREEASEKRLLPTKEAILDQGQSNPERNDTPAAIVEREPGNYTVSTGHPSKVLIKVKPLENHLLKTMIRNISAKLSPFNGTLLQRLESYLRASNYPLRDKQTIKTVAKSIFLYLVRKKPPHITQEVYNRLMELTSDEDRPKQVSQVENIIFPGPTDSYSSSEEKISQEETSEAKWTSKKSIAVTGGHHGGLSSTENLAEPYGEGEHGHSSNVVVNYKDINSAGPGHQLVLPGDAKTAEIPGLVPGTVYRIDLHGILRGQSSKSYSLLQAPATTRRRRQEPPPQPPASAEASDVTPGALSVTNSASGGLAVSWAAAPGRFRYFLVRYRDSAAPQGGEEEEVRVPGDQRSTELKHLTPGAEYEVRLSGVATEGQPTLLLTSRVIAAPPGPQDHLNHLGDLTVENVEEASFRLAWKARKGAYDSFLVRYEDTAGQLGPQETSVAGDLRASVVSGLSPDTEYAISLYGVHDGFLSRPLKTAVTTAPLEADGIRPRVENLAISDVTRSSVRLSWEVEDGDFDYFLLQYEDPQGRIQEQRIRGDLTSTTITGLLPSQNYTFTLYGISDDKRSKPVSIEVTTASAHPPAALLSQLGSLSVSEVSENSLRLSWTVRAGSFDTFLLQYRDSRAGPKRCASGETCIQLPSPASGLPGPTSSTSMVWLPKSTASRYRWKPAQPRRRSLRFRPNWGPSPPPPSPRAPSGSPGRYGAGASTFPDHVPGLRGQDAEASGRGGERAATVTGLAPATQYKFHLYGVSRHGHTKPTSTEATTALPKKTEARKASLGELSISDVTEDSLRLSWTVQDGEFDSFLLLYRDVEGKHQEVPVSGERQTATISGLKPSKKYKFTLYGVSDNKRSKPVSAEATTDCDPEGQPGDLSVSNITEDSLQLLWTVQEGEFDSFLILYRNADGEPQEVPVSGELRTTVISGLKPSKKYKFNLYGASDDKRSKPVSAEAITASLKKTTAQKASLGDLSVSDITEESLRLSWTVQDGKFDSFLILYKNADGEPQEVTVGGDFQTAIISGLRPSKKYKFTLYGVSDSKRSKPVSAEATAASVKKPATQKAILGDLSISNVTEDALRLTWTVQDGEFNSFLIQYRDTDGNPWKSPSMEKFRPPSSQASNPPGNTSLVSTVSWTTSAANLSSKIMTEKATLGDLSISDVTEDALRLSWTVQDGEFDSFLVQYSDEKGKSLEVPIDGELHTAIISDLEPSRKYNFNLYGVLDNKRSTPVSAEATTASPKTILGDLIISDITEDALRLSWTVQGREFDSFLIQYTSKIVTQKATLGNLSISNYSDEEGTSLEVPVDRDLLTTIISGLKPSKKYKFNLYGVENNERSTPVSAESPQFSIVSGGSSMTVQHHSAPYKLKSWSPNPNPQMNKILPSFMKKTLTQAAKLGDLSVANITEDSLRLSWTVQDGKFDSFLIQYKDVEGKLQEVLVGGELRTTIVAGLKPSKKYKFNLYGVSDNKRSKPVQKDDNQKATLGDLSISNITEDSLHLSWTVQGGEFDSFLILYRNADGELQEVPLDGKLQTFIITGLKPSKKYKFQFYGVSDSKRSKPVSAEAITGTVKPTLCHAVFFRMGAFGSFLIHYRDADGKPQEVPVDGAFDSTIISGLKPSKKYKFNLYGVTDNKRSKPLSAEATTASPETTVTQKASLGDLSISDVTEDSLRLSWTVQEGAFGSFLIQYDDADGELQEMPVDGASDTTIVSGLKPSKKYKFSLYGLSDDKRSRPASAEATTASSKEMMTQKASLGDLSISDVTEDSLRLSWTVQDGAFDSFLIQYRDAEGKPQEVTVDGSSDTSIVSGLKPSKKYKFSLYGLSDDKRSKPVSAEATTASPKETSDQQPRLGDLSVSEITEDSLRLSWTAHGGRFDSFLLLYRDAQGRAQKVPVAGDERSVTVAGLTPGRKVKFYLHGISGNARSKPVSIEASTVSPEKSTPGWPRLGGLAVSEVTASSLRLSWTVQGGAFDSFLIQYRDADGEPQEVPVDGSASNATILGLKPSEKYTFNLYGILADRRGPPVSAGGTTAYPEAIGQPAALLDDLHISEVGSHALQLSWDAPDGAFENFLIRYRVSTGATPETEAVVAGDLRKAPLGGLQPNTEYSFTLYGVQAGQARANLSTVGRTSRVELEAPRDLEFSDITETSAAVSWRPPLASVDRFKVSFQLAHGGEPQSINVEGRKTTTAITGLIPGARYEVIVMALRGFEESEPLMGFLTTVADGPTDLRAVNVSDSSALLLWRPALAAVDAYVVAYGAENAPTITETVSEDKSSLPLSGLSVDTEYEVQVHSTRGSKSSSPASTAFTTGADAPRDLVASGVTPRGAVLSWTAPRATPSAYVLTYEETPSGELKEVKLPASATSHELTDLFSSTRYQARLQALRGDVRTAPTSTWFTTGWLRYPFPRDCAEEQLNGIARSGPATIFLAGERKQPLKVFCDVETDGGGWLVFQRRMNGKTDFWRDWDEYAAGFGNLTQEFWLGNNNLHRLTSQGVYELRVDLRTNNESVYAVYDHFRVEPESKYYRLRLGRYSGTAGDSLSYHSGSVFSTRDRDYNRQILPCAVSYRGAWWYRNCHYSNLNGMYSNTKDHQGINWYNWKGFEFSIPFTEMKLRPRNAAALQRHRED
ncbi:LOW QUALITY PROTEIN: tenascin-X-like [Rhinatrema bivittatum]|uniref:LOW QUALITY PROTEIN: tenascin-X-like n=1 Tax=Rhinatrema bivittatum TaxID=194408 RepID=UPI001128D771|nr:LOW QUALITY PROTEIN: tenascin-X-like [Rhinatrema bivittatum]